MRVNFSEQILETEFAAAIKFIDSIYKIRFAAVYLSLFGDNNNFRCETNIGAEARIFDPIYFVEKKQYSE